MDTQNLLPLNIAARRYGIPRKWLAEEAKAGRIPSLIAAGSILFDEAILTTELLRRAGQRPRRSLLGGRA